MPALVVLLIVLAWGSAAAPASTGGAGDHRVPGAAAPEISRISDTGAGALAAARASMATVDPGAPQLLAGPASPSPHAATAPNWWNLTASAGRAPAPKVNFGMAYDAHDGYVVLFGGETLALTDASETWTFSAGHWTHLSLATHPSGREAFYFAYDDLDAELVLFGGYNYSTTGFYSDTWVFHGGAWTNVTSSVTGAPSARAGGSFAYSPTDSATILFGGIIGSNTSGTNETWKFAGSSWARVTTTVAPDPRSYPAMAYDARDGYVVLFGGYDTTSGAARSDTWKFSAGVWTALSPSTVPAGRFGALVAYDAADGYVIMQGGSGASAPVNDAWRFSSGLWSPLATATVLAGDYYGGAAFDASDQYAIVLTGNTYIGGVLQTANQTWVYAPGLGAHAKVSASAIDLGASSQFSGNGTGGVGTYLYLWEFGDGSTSGLADPAHSYTSPGVFRANFTVTDSVSVSVTASLNVTVNALPLARASAAPAATDVGLNATFSCRASQGTSPYTFAWTFGDGATASGSNVTSHAFASAGMFAVTCTATDAVGTAATSRVNATVHSLPSVTAAPLAPSTTPNVAIAFVGTATLGTPPYTVHWDFGDGLTASTLNVSHGYSAVGTYDATLTVTDAVGGSGKVTAHVTVNSPSSGAGGTIGGLSPTVVVGILVVVVLAAVIGVVLLLRSRRRKVPVPPSDPGSSAPPPTESR